MKISEILNANVITSEMLSYLRKASPEERKLFDLMGELEVFKLRMDFAKKMSDHVSVYWILKNIFHMTDEEIGNLHKAKNAEVK